MTNPRPLPSELLHMKAEVSYRHPCSHHFFLRKMHVVYGYAGRLLLCGYPSYSQMFSEIHGRSSSLPVQGSSILTHHFSMNLHQSRLGSGGPPPASRGPYISLS